MPNELRDVIPDCFPTFFPTYYPTYRITQPIFQEPWILFPNLFLYLFPNLLPNLFSFSGQQTIGLSIVYSKAILFISLASFLFYFTIFPSPSSMPSKSSKLSSTPTESSENHRYHPVKLGIVNAIRVN
jgi:hypothetical protein